MARPKKDPADKASVTVAVRLTPHQAAVLDALIGFLGAGVSRGEYMVGLLKTDYAKQLKYGGMQPVKREQGGTDG